ncbi:MAG: uridine diphosphate-N-acetylglucosamine-binding protein YvcK [Thalassotalea sp.]|nr:uridine diphosphate-N-acetylglucosamine-binding protein YvcK [Thalassotalea sp.]
MTNKHVTCIGGGHGLGHMLSVLKMIDNIDITGIVCTTDNGGSTGRLREQKETISWGDIRYCLSKLTRPSDTKSLMFEYRFDHAGDLTGHSLGNLMCLAVDSLCIRPTDSVKVMSDFLDIKAQICPMSDEVTNLVATLENGIKLFGEMQVDEYAQGGIAKLGLEPEVDTTPEIIDAIAKTDVLLIGPGSFFTSVMPSLLTRGLIEAINARSELAIYFISNVKPEFEEQAQDGEVDAQSNYVQGNHAQDNYAQDNYVKELTNNVQHLKKLGIRHTITSLICNPAVNNLSDSLPPALEPALHAPIGADENGRHQAAALKAYLTELFQP